MSAPTIYKVHELATIDANGSRAFHSFSEREVVLLVNIKSAPTGGSPTLTFTIQSVDPVDEATVVGPIATTGPLTGVGISTIRIPSISSAVLVSWVVGGSSPSFTNVNVSVFGKDAASTALVTTSGTEIGIESTPIRVDSTGSTTQPVSVVSLPLPAGAATESTLLSLASEDFATQSTLSDILTELQDKTDATDTQPISAVSLPLPTGAATEATLASIAAEDFATQTTLANILTELQQKTEPADTQPVSDAGGSLTVDASSWPLPAGASTSANQTLEINRLASIDQKFPLLGQATLASGIPVSIAANQTVIPVNDNGGSITVDATSWPLPTGAATESTQVTLLSGTTFTSRINTFGQKTMANSTPIVIASDQVMPLPSGAATETTLSGINKSVIDLRDNQGIKRINDALPYGDNNIGRIKITDGGGSGRTVAVDSANRLVVSANATIVPAASVAVEQSDVSDLTGTDDLVYVIPSGKKLTISRFAGGAEGNSGKVSKVSLFYDPLGTGSGMDTIRLMYLSGNNWEFGLDYQVTGDGTKAIRMRRERLDGASDEVAAFWSGFREE
jgi:hypothetical protein